MKVEHEVFAVQREINNCRREQREGRRIRSGHGGLSRRHSQSSAKGNQVACCGKRKQRRLGRSCSMIMLLKRLKRLTRHKGIEANPLVASRDAKECKLLSQSWARGVPDRGTEHFLIRICDNVTR